MRKDMLKRQAVKTLNAAFSLSHDPAARGFASLFPKVDKEWKISGVFVFN
jgi:hypothetical protein